MFDHSWAAGYDSSDSANWQLTGSSKHSGTLDSDPNRSIIEVLSYMRHDNRKSANAKRLYRRTQSSPQKTLVSKVKISQLYSIASS